MGCNRYHRKLKLLNECALRDILPNVNNLKKLWGAPKHEKIIVNGLNCFIIGNRISSMWK